MKGYVSAWVCACVCVCARIYPSIPRSCHRPSKRKEVVRVCVCVCVWKPTRSGQLQYFGHDLGHLEVEGVVCVCVCVCVCEAGGGAPTPTPAHTPCMSECNLAKRDVCVCVCVCVSGRREVSV